MPGWPQCRAPHAAQAGDDIEGAVGQADIARKLGDAQYRERSILRGLDDAGIAGSERRADGAPENLHRIVPRDDMPGDAVRHALDGDEMRAEIRHDIAMQLVGGGAVIFEIAGERDCIGPRLAQRLAVVAAFECCEFVRAALRWRAASFRSKRPRSVAVSLPQTPSKALPCGANSGVDVSRSPRRDRAKTFPSTGETTSRIAPLGGRHVAATDQVGMGRDLGAGCDGRSFMRCLLRPVGAEACRHPAPPTEADVYRLLRGLANRFAVSAISTIRPCA